MIRAIFDPTITYSNKPIEQKGAAPDWKRSLRYLAETRSIYRKISGGCSLVNKISHLKPLSPLANGLKTVLRPLGDASKTASLYLTIEKFSTQVYERKIGCDLHSAKEVLGIVDAGIDLATWFAMVGNLGYSLRVISALPSISLATALLSPTLDLIHHLREEGLGAFNEASCYKTSYKLGLALLAIYLFMASVTLSAQLDIVISGVNFALLFV